VKARLLAAVLTVLCVSPGSVARAAPGKTTLDVTTMAGPRRLPKSLVTAAWSVDSDQSDHLAISGHNVPACLTLVQATWNGNRHGDRTGRFIELRHDYTYDAVREGASAELLVEYRLKSGWYVGMHVTVDYVGTLGLTRKSVTSGISVRSSAVAGKTVPVRVSLTIRYPEPAFNIDDTFRVLPQQ
jgi:hypothetical protein